MKQYHQIIQQFMEQFIKSVHNQKHSKSLNLSLPVLKNRQNLEYVVYQEKILFFNHQ